MSSDRAARCLNDIIETIDRIDRHIAGMDQAAFLGDEKAHDAVERCLARICEAARKLGPRYDDLAPEAEWPKIRALGSVLRHDYDEILADEIWRTVTTRLAPLRDTCQRLVAGEVTSDGNDM